MEFEGAINLSDLSLKRKFMAQVGAAQGPHRIAIKPHRQNRSGAANRYYFGVVVAALVEFEREQGNSITPDQGHWLLSLHNNGVDWVNPETGVVTQDPDPDYVWAQDKAEEMAAYAAKQ